MSRNLSKIRSWEDLAQHAGFQPAAMAARCDISLRQLERFFAGNFHKTPKIWARELRCSLAKKLLAEGWTNKAVAHELKFTDDSHLCHEFKNLFGFPPRAFGPTNRNSKNVAFLQ
jgi:AraC-like DNA-binding protein